MGGVGVVKVLRKIISTLFLEEVGGGKGNDDELGCLLIKERSNTNYSQVVNDKKIRQ